MRVSAFLSIVLILMLWSCIDRFFYDIALPQGVPIAVSGHITNQPGPYKININTSFDINSKENIKTPVSVKHVNLMDERGTSEELSEVTPGVYQTSATGIKGRIGGVYKLRIELHDGKIYESIPDTLLAPGKIDSLYHDFYTGVDASGTTRYGFDVMINSSSNSKTMRNMWNFRGTFKSLTHPESISNGPCYPLPGIPCNFLPPCTGLKNVAEFWRTPIYERVGPCECCSCWYTIFNTSPILSDEIYANGSYKATKIYNVPLNEWIFQDKIYTLVTQTTLTVQSFQYFKSIKDQKESIGSLSQPTVGKIPNTFVQIEGASAPINGIFYSAGTDSRSMYITPLDVRGTVPIPTVHYELGIGSVSCLDLFPNATNVQPDFWID